MSERDGFLHVGDMVTLFVDENNGYMGTEGIHSFQLGVREAVPGIPLVPKVLERESVFMVMQQHNYSVDRQMRAFLEREGLTLSEAQAESALFRECARARMLMRPRKRAGLSLDGGAVRACAL
jgi:hypothetical protein